MKNILTLLLTLLCAMPPAVAQDDAVIQAVTTDIKNPDYGGVEVGGFVKFAAQSPIEPAIVFDDANYGVLNYRTTVCLYYEGKMLVYKYRTNSIGLSYVRFYTYRLSNGAWSLDMDNDYKELTAAYTSFPHAMTYNPQNGVVYGYRNDQNAQILTIDPATGSMTVTLTLPEGQRYNSLATSPSGVTYATNTSGELFTLDLTTGVENKIGSTGVKSADILPTVIDPATGRMFLYMPSGDAGILYEIDLTTAAATKIADISEDKLGNIRALFSTSEASDTQALTPGLCQQAAIEPLQPGSLQATLKATAPTLATDKKTQLEGKVGIKFYIDDIAEPVATIDNLEPGEAAQASYTFTEEGMHALKAVAYNEKGDGAPTSLRQYIGFDTPLPPSDITLSVAGDLTYTLTWTPPTQGVNGGAVDTKSLTYKVTRYPDSQVTENVTQTSLSGKLPVGTQRDYYFGVEPQAGEKTGEEAFSNHVKCGDAYELPYGQYFNSEDDYTLHTIVDRNGGATWKYGTNMMGNKSPEYNGNQQTAAADDWLISPPFKIHAGVTYTVTITVHSAYNQDSGNNLAIYTGTDINNLDAFNLVGDKTNIPDYTEGSTTYSANYTAETDHTGYFAFQCHSAAKRRMFLEQYEISATTAQTAPAAPDDFTATPDPQGQLSATITLTAPSLTTDGKQLTSLTSVKIYRDDNLNEIHTFDAPTPGQELSFTDTTPTQGTHTYKAIAFNDSGAGETAESATYVGEDYPGAVTDLAITDDDDYIYLNWTAPTESANGYYLDFDAMTYAVYYLYGQMESPSLLIDGVTKTNLTIEKSGIASLLGSSQALLTFYVLAQSSAGVGYPGYGDIIYGDPYGLPFAESFYNSYTDTDPWTTIDPGNEGKTYTSAWFMAKDGGSSPTSTTSYDNDGGLAVFYQTAYDTYSQRLVAPKVSIEGAEKPVITFYMYHHQASGDNYLQVEAINGVETIALGDPINLSDGSGWELHTIDLSSLPVKAFRPSFLARAAKGVDLCIDNIEVKDAATEGITPATTDGAPAITALKGAIALTGTASTYAIYNVQGQCVAQGKLSGTIRIPLPQGCYIVKAGATSAKAAVE